MAAAPKFVGEASALEASAAEAHGESGFFYLNPS
jgi:hypothetical protein